MVTSVIKLSRGKARRMGRPRASATIFSPLLLIVAEDIEGEAWRHYYRRFTARLSRA